MLSVKEIKDRIKQMSDENYPLTDNQIIIAEEIYYKAMVENLNVKKSNDDQISLIDEITRKLYIGQTSESVFMEHSDVRHLSFYNTFLGDGEAQNIKDVFFKHSIPTDILRGVKLNSPGIIEKNGVTVEYFITSYIDDEHSGDDDNFTIYKDGIKIYEWNRLNAGGTMYYNTKDDIILNYEERKIPNIKNKDGTVRKSIRLKTVVSRNYSYTESISSNGQIIRQNTKGQFVRKDGKNKGDIV